MIFKKIVLAPAILILLIAIDNWCVMSALVPQPCNDLHLSRQVNNAGWLLCAEVTSAGRRGSIHDEKDVLATELGMAAKLETMFLAQRIEVDFGGMSSQSRFEIVVASASLVVNSTFF